MSSDERREPADLNDRPERAWAKPSLSDAIVAAAGVALVAADRNGIVRLWNPAAARMFGAEASVILGTRIDAVLPRDARDAAERAIARALFDRATTELEFRYPDEHGRFRELAVSVTPLAQGDEKPVGVLLAARDITRRFEAERQLGEARKMAALGDMAGAIAHHFNNILGGIMTTVDFALSTGDAALFRQALTKTAEQSARAARLLRGLLSFAEGDLQKGPSASIDEVLTAVVETTYALAAERRVTVHLESRPLPSRTFPLKALSTALEELVKNAIEATAPQGRVELRAETDGADVVIEVRDAGCGLPAEVLPRIFEPFYRVAEESSSGFSNEHAGLGLSIAYGIVRALGGSIEVSSIAGKGSCFRVRFGARAPVTEGIRDGT